MTTITPKIDANPRVLEWARLEAGFTIEEAAKKLGTKPQRLMSWELGADRPSLAQLRKAGETYSRTLAFFLLDAVPPSDLPTIQDFRGFAAAQISPALRREMRKVVRRR